MCASLQKFKFIKSEYNNLNTSSETSEEEEADENNPAGGVKRVRRKKKAQQPSIFDNNRPTKFLGINHTWFEIRLVEYFKFCECLLKSLEGKINMDSSDGDDESKTDSESDFDDNVVNDLAKDKDVYWD